MNKLPIQPDIDRFAAEFAEALRPARHVRPRVSARHAFQAISVRAVYALPVFILVFILSVVQR
jgi:hypothetical protein